MPHDPTTYRNAIRALLSAREAQGHWVGRLSASALSTATATAALSLHERAHAEANPSHRKLISNGAAWLVRHQNADGGWGDTTRSFSNISTTALCWAALSLVHDNPSGGEADEAPLATDRAAVIDRAQTWLVDAAGSIEPASLANALMARYGKDRTFSVPILTMCALCSRMGDPAEASTWRRVKQLPFELAALPMTWFRWLQLPVVSYALPALIAIGLVRHTHRPTWNPLTRALRSLTRKRVLRVLDRIQPPNGGFLEATPLTSFVSMSLIGAGLADHPVVRRGIGFIVDSVRDDGSWPIDTNLSTWVTTLSINALSAGERLHEHIDSDGRSRLTAWLIDQQYTDWHPYTNAPPGGWAWTPLPGGVPDLDDTSGAVLALANLGLADLHEAEEGVEILSDASSTQCRQAQEAATGGLGWLMRLQNSDGGLPTFCKGWGNLPFDRSSCDITAHALRAAAVAMDWQDHLRAFGDRRRVSDVLSLRLETFVQQAAPRMIQYLLREQQEDGSWKPLWFGNQHLDDEANRTYATTRVLLALWSRLGDDASRGAANRGLVWLLDTQRDDGGWSGGPGGEPSIEETALALEAIAFAPRGNGEAIDKRCRSAADRAAAWLKGRTNLGADFQAAPIGFYFAKLWYYERLYPVIWTVAALEAIHRRSK